MNPLQYLLSIESKGIKLGLERTEALMKRCKNPQVGLPVVQIAGTNGKGSTAAFLSHILQCAGYKVGLFTSPHLVNVNERIRINGKAIPTEYIDQFINRYKLDIESISASFFETITAMGFTYFKDWQVDIAIMETGLGGRLDSVSICEPILTIITPISLDHVEILGDSLQKIAFEKAGIMKSGVQCISAEQAEVVHSVLIDEAQKKNVELAFMKKYSSHTYQPNIPGKFQNQNAKLAINALHFLKNFTIDDSAIKEGVETVTWYGRNQIIQKDPLIIFDVGHNSEGILSYIEYFKTVKPSGESTLIFSLQHRKQFSMIAPLLCDVFDLIICCETDNPRTMTIEQMLDQFDHHPKVTTIKDSIGAINRAQSLVRKGDSISIIGTHFFGEPISQIFNISFNSL